MGVVNFRARAWKSLLLLPVLVLLMAGRQVPLVDPEPIAVPAGLTAAQVAKSIKAALVGRQWTVTEEQPGRIVSTLNLRTHMAKIEIAYGSAITIRYLDSSELMYDEKKGQKVIHRNYLNWIQNLVNDIQRNMTLVQS
jgi:hypothetical protein